jgi:Branched-chain amino acid ABC-type transport system, permease components
MGASFSLLIGQTINGLVLGNVYALLAAGLALIFGVAGLINFAQGSVYMAGSYALWVFVALLGWPLWAGLLGAALFGAVLGLAIERLALRPLKKTGGITPFLATIGVGLVIDSGVEIIFTPNPKSFPKLLPEGRIELGLASVGFMDLLVLGLCLASALGLFLLLTRTQAGRALRAAAQDPETASSMGVRVKRVNSAVFALASALGSLAGALVGLYYNLILPSSGAQAGLKGFTACVLGGLGSVPAAMAGGLVLGLGESYAVAIFGSSSRSLVAYAFLLLALFLKPNGIFGGKPRPIREVLTGSFLPQAKAIKPPRALAAFIVVAAFALPLAVKSGYVLQILSQAWIYGVFALSLSLASGTGGIMSMGQAGFMAIGAYASALLTLKAGWPFAASFFAAGLVAAVLGSLLAAPALRLKGHYIAIATMGIGEMVCQIILNWESLTRGAMGLAGIPAPRLFGLEISSASGFYYLSLAVLVLCAAAIAAIGDSPLGRSARALREDESAARSLGVDARRYRSLVFGLGAFFAGLAGSLTAHLYTYISYDTFGGSLSILGVTMAIFGGLGNIWGAILGALSLTALPEALRFASAYRTLAYGLALLLVLRFRPQGVLGSE